LPTYTLVAVDGSDISMQALHEAVKLSKGLNTKLRIIHVVDEYRVNYVRADINYVELEASFKEYDQKVLDNMEVIARQSKVKVDSQLVEIKAYSGRTAEKIIEAAKHGRLI
jgi:nucleotide-binding universal stress UspA family protein